ncbi:hypothetical protein Bbelb_040910 [Branchiostoma belcheri]|nr:hypothetical protein Bbelb_040910 [Branchiostoma belcheri]
MSGGYYGFRQYSEYSDEYGDSDDEDSDDYDSDDDDYDSDSDDVYVTRTIRSRTLADGSRHFTNQAQGSELLAELVSQRKTGQFLDVVVQVEGREFPCHRAVLASTPYFKAMLSSNLAESSSRVVQLHEIDSNSFSKILDFLYTGKIRIGKDDVQDILKTAHMLQLDKIVEFCCGFLQDYLCPSNCLGVIRLAELYGFSLLKTRARNMALSKFPDVSQDEEFLTLSVQELADLLGDKDLRVKNEEDIVHSVLRWLDHHPEKPRTGILEVIQEIHLSCVRVSVLQQLESHPVLHESTECLAKITAAKEKHILGTKVEGEDVSCPRRRDNLAIIVGGWKAVSAHPTPLQRLICFDPDRKKEFYDITTLPTPVSGYMSVASAGRHLYVTGGRVHPLLGQGPHSAPSRQAYRYDFPSDAWLKLPDMPRGRAGHQSVVVDGKLFVVGGDTDHEMTSSMTIDCYDPEEGAWIKDCVGPPFATVLPKLLTSSSLTVTAHGDRIVFISLSKIVNMSQSQRGGQRKLCIHAFDVTTNDVKYADILVGNPDLEDVIRATPVNDKLYILVDIDRFDCLYIFNVKEETLTWGDRRDWIEKVLRTERKTSYCNMDVPKGVMNTITSYIWSDSDTIGIGIDTSLPFPIFGHSFLQTKKSRVGWYCRDLAALKRDDECEDESS